MADRNKVCDEGTSIILQRHPETDISLEIWPDLRKLGWGHATNKKVMS